MLGQMIKRKLGVLIIVCIERFKTSDFELLSPNAWHAFLQKYEGSQPGILPSGQSITGQFPAKPELTYLYN